MTSIRLSRLGLMGSKCFFCFDMCAFVDGGLRVVWSSQFDWRH